MVFPWNCESAGSKDGAPGALDTAGGVWEVEAVEVWGRNWVSSTL